MLLPRIRKLSQNLAYCLASSVMCSLAEVGGLSHAVESGSSTFTPSWSPPSAIAAASRFANVSRRSANRLR